MIILRHCDKSNEPIDPPLSEQGKEQASKLSFNVDIVMVSPLKRALQTYTESNIRTKHLIVDSNLIEKNQMMYNEYKELDEDLKGLGEMEESFKERVRSVLNNIKRLSSCDKSIMVISHEDFLFELQKQCRIMEPRMLEPGESRVVNLSPSRSWWERLWS